MNTLHQYMVSKAFRSGLYDPLVTIAQLKQCGSFGLGEFEALGGELIAWNGTFYRATADGKLTVAADSERLCVAQVSGFQPSQSLAAPAGLANSTIGGFLRPTLGTDNTFFALGVAGQFDSVQATAFHPQAKPYPTYAQMLRDPPTFTFHHVAGRLVAYYAPPYVQDVGIPGYHFHFLADDLSGGGHVTSFVLSAGTITFEEFNDLRLTIPEYADFRKANLGS